MQRVHWLAVTFFFFLFVQVVNTQEKTEDNGDDFSLPESLSLSDIKRRIHESETSQFRREFRRDDKVPKWLSSSEEDSLLNDPRRPPHLGENLFQELLADRERRKFVFGSHADALFYCDPRSPSHLRGNDKENRKRCEAIIANTKRRLLAEKAELKAEQQDKRKTLHAKSERAHQKKEESVLGLGGLTDALSLEQLKEIKNKLAKKRKARAGEKSGRSDSLSQSDPTAPKVGDSTTAPGGDSTAPKAGDSTTAPGGDPTALKAGDSTTAPGGDPSAPKAGDSTTAPGGDPSAPKAGDSTTAPGGDPTAPKVGDSTTAPGGDPSAPRAGDSTTAPGGDPSAPKAGDSLGPEVSGVKPKIPPPSPGDVRNLEKALQGDQSALQKLIGKITGIAKNLGPAAIQALITGNKAGLVQRGIATLTQQLGLSPAPANIQGLFNLINSPQGRGILSALGITAPPRTLDELLYMVAMTGLNALTQEKQQQAEAAQQEEGEDKTEEGSEKNEEGEDKTEEGSEKNEEGEDKTEEGSEKKEEGEDKTEEGSEKKEEGEDKTEEGSEKKEEGEDKTEGDSEKKGDEKAKDQAKKRINDANKESKPSLGDALATLSLGIDTSGLADVANIVKQMTPVDQDTLAGLLNAHKDALVSLGLAVVAAVLEMNPPPENAEQLLEMVTGPKGGAILSALNLDAAPEDPNEFAAAVAAAGLGAFMEKEAYETAVAEGASPAEAKKQSKAYSSLIENVITSVVTPITREAIEQFNQNKKKNLLRDALYFIAKALDLDPPPASMNELMERFQGDNATLLAQKLGMSAVPKTLAELEREMLNLAENEALKQLKEEKIPTTTEELKQFLVERDGAILSAVMGLCQDASASLQGGDTENICGRAINEITERIAKHSDDTPIDEPESEIPEYAKEEEEEDYLHEKKPSKYADSEELEEAEREKAEGGFQYKTKQAVLAGEDVAEGLAHNTEEKPAEENNE